MPKTLCPEQELSLTFEGLRDFRPRHLVSKNPFIHAVVQAIDIVSKADSQKLSGQWITEQLGQWPDLPVDLSSFDLETVPQKPTGGTTSMDRILDMVSMPEPGSSRGLAALKSALQVHLQALLTHIYSRKAFRQLEALWRSLNLLFSQRGRDQSIICRIVPYEPGDLETALSRVFSELILDPPSLILVDEPFDASPASIRLMDQAAGIAQTLLAPAICWVGPAFFHCTTWTEWDRLPYLPHHLQRPEYAKLRAVRQQPAASWMGLSCNRFLLRPSYTRTSGEEEGALRFEEKDRPWGSPVYALAALMLSSTAVYGWPTHVSEWKRIRLEGMPVVETDTRPRPTEATLSDERLHQMSRIGLIPLMGQSGRDILFSPVDTTLGGEPLSRQLFISSISRELIRCKDAYGGQSSSKQEISRYLHRCCDRIWQERGGVQPDSVHLDVQETGSGSRSRISIAPSRGMLPGAGGDVVLDLDW
ncbi:MAG: type VI secretion system contractile sheath large subunit, partial [Desulfovermiculus sp.]|nr:type VI secretion system contractile sheath large subunit [Desulfovermiculus sp.]